MSPKKEKLDSMEKYRLEEKVIERTKELRKSEKKYRILFEKSPFFIGILNRQGVLIDASDGIEEFMSST